MVKFRWISFEENDAISMWNYGEIPLNKFWGEWCGYILFIVYFFFQEIIFIMA